MKRRIAICVLMLVAAGCDSSDKGYSSVKVTIPEGANIRQEDIAREISASLPLNPQGATLEIIIYDYSSGKERLLVSANGEINETHEAGYIKFLLCIKEEGGIKQASFLQITHMPDKDYMPDLKQAIAAALKN